MKEVIKCLIQDTCYKTRPLLLIPKTKLLQFIDVYAFLILNFLNFI